MSFLDELPILLCKPVGYAPLSCDCEEALATDADICEVCGSPIEKDEQMMYLCSLHRKVELSQEVHPDRSFEVVCLVCGAIWTVPEMSVGEHPDDYVTPWLLQYQAQYFMKFFGVTL